MSNAADAVLKTYGLGSCVGVMIYDKAAHVGGLLHVAYPESRANPKKAESLPGYFVDTGLPLFLRAFAKLSSMERRNIGIRLAGGANMLDEEGRFNIGKRNVLAVKRVLWRLGMGVVQEDTGGAISRTVTFSVDTGNLVLSNGKHRWEL